MSQYDWYRRNPADALFGMALLSNEECGAYNRIIDLIYWTGNRLHDDDKFMCGWLRCDTRVWHRLRRALIEHGKIRVENGFIRNERATNELSYAAAKGLATAQLNATKGIKSGVARRKNNGLTEPAEKHRYLDHKEDLDIELDSMAQTAPTTTRTRRERGTRVPDDFEPEAESNEIGFAAGMTEKEILNELNRFTDYWRAKPGAGGVKLDWEATWRNWLREAIDRRGKNQANFGFNGQHGGRR